jgi:glutamate 5-kinase
LIFCAKPKGRLWIDDGAKKALLNDKSLLSVGLIKHEGRFTSDDIVEIADASGAVFGRGKVNFSAHELDAVKGQKKIKELIHKDDLVLIEG